MTLKSRFSLFVLLAATSCSRSGPELGAIERLTTDPGTLGRFMTPYYARLTVLPGGGAVSIWMKEETPYRPVVFRYAPDATGSFAPESYLSPDDMRQTVTLTLTALPGGDGEIYVAWQARYPKTGDKFVVFRRSRDHGRSWSEPRRLNVEPTAFEPSLAADDAGGVYAAWPDERVKTTVVFFNRSLDRGENWLPSDVRVDGVDPGQMARAISLASDGQSSLLAVWEDQSREGRVLKAATSADRGATWSAPVTINDGRRGGSPTAPRAVIAEGRAVVVWSAAVTGVGASSAVWADSSTDGGRTWGQDVLLHEQPGGAAPAVQLVADGPRAHVVFDASVRGGDQEIYHVAMDADGKWNVSAEGLAPITPPDGKFSSPRLARDADGTLYLVYKELTRRVFLTRSKDGGEHWREPTLIHDVGDTAPKTAVNLPQVAVGDGIVYVMWEEWGDPREVAKTLADAQNSKRVPADLFVRRVIFRDQGS